VCSSEKLFKVQGLKNNLVWIFSPSVSLNILFSDKNAVRRLFHAFCAVTDNSVFQL